MATLSFRRSVSIVLGVTATGLGCYGAWTAAYALEGGTSYLTIASPVVALAAALIPPMAEAHWRSKEYVKSLLWWAVLIPAAAVVFLASFERVHYAKAGQAAEITAQQNAVKRAASDLAEAKAALPEAEAKERKAKAQKTCGPVCRADKQGGEDARNRVAQAELSLHKAEAAARAEASLKAPAWLLPFALDAVAFMAIWSAFTGPKPEPKEPPKRKPVKAKRIRRTTKRLPKVKGVKGIKTFPATVSNDNVFPMRAS